MDIQNPHDKYFKQTFSDLNNVKDLIRNTIPKDITDKIDFNKVDILNTNFVDEDLKEIYSDLLVKTSIKNKKVFLYFLYEHKSYPERYTNFQLLKYMIGIWDNDIKENKKKVNYNLTPIVPVIFYYGKEKWKYENAFDIYFEDNELYSRYIPSFESIIYDLTTIKDDEIKGNISYILSMMTMKYIFRSIFKKLPLIFSILESSTERDSYLSAILQSIAVYILSVTDDVTSDTIINNLNKQVFKEEIMSVKDQLINEGIEKGIEKGKREIAVKLKKKGMPIDEIIEITGLSKEEIEKLK